MANPDYLTRMLYYINNGLGYENTAEMLNREGYLSPRGEPLTAYDIKRRMHSMRQALRRKQQSAQSK